MELTVKYVYHIAIGLIKRISSKETEVLMMLYEGKLPSDIAIELKISTCTVNHHIQRMHNEFKCPSTRQMLMLIEHQKLVVKVE